MKGLENSAGAYTARRRPELAAGWLRSHEAMVTEAKAGGWFLALSRAVEDGANMLAQIEWAEKHNPGWRLPRWHAVNVIEDGRGWSIHIPTERLAVWRNWRRVA